MHSTNRIQEFLRKRVENLKRQKSKDFFGNNAKKLLSKKISNAAKFTKLRASMEVDPFAKFMSNLKYHLVLKKLLLFLLKRFSNIDDKLKNLYMQKYLRDWLNQTNKLNRARNAAATMIQRNVKPFLVRLKFLPLLHKGKIMLKLKDKFENTMFLKFQTYFLNWMKLAKVMNTFDAAKVLQKYLRKINLKSKDLKDNDLKDRVKQATDLLQNHINNAKKAKAFEALKNKSDKNFYNKLAKMIKDKVNGRRSYFIQKAKDYVKQKHLCATKIQKEFRDYMFGRKFAKILFKIRKLRWLLNQMANRDSRFKHKCLIAWQKKAYQIRLQDSAKEMQLFVKRSLLKYRKKQRQLAKLRLRNFTIWNVLRGNLVPVAKMYNNNVRFTKAYPLVHRYLLKKFMHKLSHYDKLMSCSIIHNIRKKIIKRFMKKRFNTWAKNAQKLKLVRNTSMIQKNYRIYISRKRHERLKEHMDNILKNLALKHINKRGYYLNQWNFNVKSIRIKEATKSLSNFTKKYLLRLKAQKKWKKWADLISKYENQFDWKDIILRAKQNRTLSELYKKFYNHIVIEGWKEFAERMRKIKVMRLVQMLFGNYEKRIENLTKLVKLRLWLKETRRLVRKDEATANMVNAINKRRIIMSADKMNDFFTYFRLRKLIMLIRAKWGIHQIKALCAHKKRCVRLFELMQKADSEATDKNKSFFNNKVCQVYFYKILKKVAYKIELIDKKKFQPAFKKYFINLLKQRYFSESLFNYDGTQRNRAIQRESTKLSFDAMAYSLVELGKEKGQNEDNDMFGATVFVEIIKSLIRKRRKWSNDALKELYRSSKFVSLMNQYVVKHLPREEFWKKFYAYYIYKKETPIKIRMLRSLLRRYAFMRLSEDNKLISRQLRLRNFVKMCLLGEGVLHYKVLKKYLRMWSYKITIKNMAREKLLKLYQNMQLQFLSLAQNMFSGEGAGIADEINSLNEKFGLFTSDNNTNSFYKKKLCKGYNKRYIWADNTEIEKSEEVVVEEKPEPVVEKQQPKKEKAVKTK